MQSRVARGHNPAPLLSKGGVHQPKKEHVPELEYDLYDYYLEDIMISSIEDINGELDSPESLFA